ncbi:MAG TPA: hypothetical protein VGO87_07285 [Acidimicrobiia bacterium]
MPAGLQRGLVALLAVAAVVAVIALAHTARRQRSTVPLLVLLGALLCVVYEPIGDRMVLAYYPEHGQITWVTLFGRGIPVFIGLMYIAYIGPFVLLFDHLRNRGFTVRSWWALWAGSAATIVLVELAVLRIGPAWVYYGPQRTVVGDLPLWTPFTYVAFLFAIAAGVHTLATRLTGRRRWLIIPAVPTLLAAAHLTTSLPGALALYHSTDPTLILAGALTSVALSALLTWALGLLFVLRPAEAPARDRTGVGNSPYA